MRVLLPPSGLLTFPRWGKAGMGAGHAPEYEQVQQQMPGWPPPSPSGGGISCSLSRLRERVRVRVLLPPAHLCSAPSGLLSFPLWGEAGMGAGHDPEYEQVKQQMPGWPPPSPSPSGGGISCSLSRLRERVRVRVLLPPAHLCSAPSGLLSFPLWGKAGMGAGHDPEYEQVKQQISGWPPPSPSPCPLPQVGEGVHAPKKKYPLPFTGEGQGEGKSLAQWLRIMVP